MKKITKKFDHDNVTIFANTKPNNFPFENFVTNPILQIRTKYKSKYRLVKYK